MCVLALAWEAHPNWRLVLAGNRDEMHARPAAPLRRWAAPDHLLAGQDLMSGGTWLGVSEQGRLAVVTNLRGFGLADAGRPSRGLLLRDLLGGEGRYANPVATDLAAFNPLNLITVQDGAATFWSNQPAPERRILPPAIYGLSNGGLDEPWPKTVRLKAILRDWIEVGAAPAEALLDGLHEETLPPDGGPPTTPSDVPQEPAQSAIFIRNPVYGTRCSTVVAIDHAGQGLIVERRFDAAGAAEGETALPFSWPWPS
ncbi:MAG: NRDE family protein [Caulobacteraceae bacterium]